MRYNVKCSIPSVSLESKRSGSGLCLHRITTNKEAYKIVFGLWQGGWDQSERSKGGQNRNHKCKQTNRVQPGGLFINAVPSAAGYTSMWSLCVFECIHMCVCVRVCVCWGGGEEYRGSKIGRLFWPVISQLRHGLVTLAGSEVMTDWPSRPHTGCCADPLWQVCETAGPTGWVYSDLTCGFHLFLTKTSGVHQPSKRGRGGRG